MRIKVRAMNPFKETLGTNELELERPDGETVEELIRALVGEHPAFGPHALDDDGGIEVTLNIMVSGRPVTVDGLSSPLEDGDEVLLFMPLSGG